MGQLIFLIDYLIDYKNKSNKTGKKVLTSKIFFAIILKHLRDCTIYSSIAQSVDQVSHFYTE